MPDTRTSMKDEANNFVYHVLAYRKLDKREMLEAVAAYRSQPKVRRRKRPPHNGSVTIFTIHGATPSL